MTQLATNRRSTNRDESISLPLEAEEAEIATCVAQVRAHLADITERRETMQRAMQRLEQPPVATRTQRAPHPSTLLHELEVVELELEQEVRAARRRAVAKMRQAVETTAERLRDIEFAMREDLADTDRLLARRASDQAQRAATPKLDERRSAQRHDVVAEVDFVSEDNLYTGFSTDLSEGGVFVATVDLLPIGTPVNLTLALPGGMRLSLTGQVRWLRDCQDRSPDICAGMGIQFVGLDERTAQPLREFLRRREPVFYAD